MDHHLEAIADLQLFRLNGKRELTERKNAFRLAADIDEKLVLILGDDDALENLTFIKDFEALFVEALF